MKPAVRPVSTYRKSLQGARSNAGFTLFELAVCVVAFGVLAFVLSERLLVYQEYAEKTAMEITVRNVRTGLQNQVADLMNQDRMREADRLLQVNPISWLERPPPNYRGEVSNARVEQLDPGHWYFDATQHQLLYLPKRHRFFTPVRAGDYLVRLQVTAVRAAGGPPRGSGPSVERLALSLLTPYRWEWPQ